MAARCSSSSRFMSSGSILLPKGYSRRSVSPSERCSSPDLNYSSSSRGCFSSRAVSQQMTSRPQVMSVSPSSRSSMDRRPMSPCNQVVKKEGNQTLLSASQTRRSTCSCSPSTHPGSFRCMFHRKRDGAVVASNLYASEGLKLNLQKSPSDGLNLQKYAITKCMMNHKDIVVEGDSVKKALKDLIRPSICDPRRRKKIQLRPSRLSVMLKNEED
ncbi:O-mannosyltransferase [Thalictrum thalictroides]|uniref:O-mannosyltransferase n=1 Tax=Thalictrum thalictroides TaxID=46969 RepID=A0A7J6W5U7_THATH|nr:O-mannosyltransferase [Thalictrum thalictroides]